MNKEDIEYNKFIVIKTEDINRYLPDKTKMDLMKILHFINFSRLNEGKNLNNYLVINIDEKNIDKILELI